MTDDRIDQMASDVAYIRTRLDQHLIAQAERERVTEGRLTTMEAKSGLWGFIGGFMALLGAKWFGQ